MVLFNRLLWNRAVKTFSQNTLTFSLIRISVFWNRKNHRLNSPISHATYQGHRIYHAFGNEVKLWTGIANLCKNPISHIAVPGPQRPNHTHIKNNLHIWRYLHIQGIPKTQLQRPRLQNHPRVPNETLEAVMQILRLFVVFLPQIRCTARE